MRKLLLTFLFVLAANPARADFSCGTPTAATPLDEQDKAAISEISAKFKQWKMQLGPPNGIMCEAPDGRGKFWHYDNGSIFWSPETGAAVVMGLIRQHWAKTGWEKGWLGYPMTDEINSYDGKAKLSKFQNGQLVWRPWTNSVTEAGVSDLQVDLPTEVGKSWRVTQANGHPGSHEGPWAYCYDFVSNDGPTDGASFLSTADAKVVFVAEGAADHDYSKSNVIVQSLGVGRYASSLHVQTSSYSQTFGKGKLPVIATTAWSTRPVAKSGVPIARVGTTGTGIDTNNDGKHDADNHHIHYCITTSPDDAQYAPFESVPFSFRNFEVLEGGVWKKVTFGRPIAGQVVRRPVNSVGGLATINPAATASIVNVGQVSGVISLPSTAVALPPGLIKVSAITPWGEPVRSTTISVGTANKAGPFAYVLSDVPNYPGMRVEAAFSQPATVFPLTSAAAASVAFQPEINASKTVDLKLVVSTKVIVVPQGPTVIPSIGKPGKP